MKDFFFIFDDEDGKTLKQTDQRGGRCTVPGNIQGQAGQSTEKPGEIDVPVHCRKVVVGDL